jgi:alkylhydroperoxidase family enzyme
MRLKEPRIPPLPESAWTDEIRALLPPAMGAGRPLNIFTTLVRHPTLFKNWMAFAGYVLLGSSLPPRERELVLLRVGWVCRSEYEFGQHRLIARACGVSDDEIRRVTHGPADPGWSDRDRTLLQAVDELHADQMIEDATWTALCGAWSDKQILDLLFAVGQYTLVSMVLNTLGVQLEDGALGFPT